MRRLFDCCRRGKREKTDGLSLGFLFVIALVLQACNLDLTNGEEDACTPKCNGTVYCQDDGCGGICECPVGLVCSESGACIDENVCTLDCSALGWECGQICGNDCGKCQAPGVCNQGTCCLPSCDGTHCGPNGCGGTCACGSGSSCDANTGLCVPGDECEGVADPCAGKQCGTVCGVSCGECPQPADTCVDNACVCNPWPCDGTRCIDGCGGDCACGEGETCDADRYCQEECQDTCSEQGWQCGALCGTECGPCSSSETCNQTTHLCECVPDAECGKTRCVDGCGGTCGCPESTECNLSGDCVEDCEDTCASTGHVCGEVCGEDCGDCSDGEACVEGSCYPSTLTLTVESTETVDNKKVVTLRVDYKPQDLEPRPRMVDLRIDVSPVEAIELESLTAGTAMDGKDLYIDPYSLKPWRVRPDGSIQMLIYSLGDPSRLLETGSLMWMTFTYDPSADTSSSNALSFSIVRRNQVFAPFEADMALQQTAYDMPVQVTK